MIKVLEGHTEHIRHAAFSPDGSLVATASDDFAIRVWHAHDGSASGILTGHRAGILSLEFASNTRILSGSLDGTMRLWSLDTFQTRVVSERRSYNGGAGAVSDDGAFVSMSWGDTEVRVFDSTSGNIIAMLKTLPSEQFQKFVPRSRLLMVTSNYGTEIWSLPAGKKIGEVTLPFAFGQTIYIAPSGDRFAVRDRRGLRDMYIWPTISALLSGAERFSIDDLSGDERYARFLQ